MASKGTQRKLTAILCADMAGYSRLMGDDDPAVRTREIFPFFHKFQTHGKVRNRSLFCRMWFKLTPQDQQISAGGPQNEPGGIYSLLSICGAPSDSKSLNYPNRLRFSVASWLTGTLEGKSNLM